MTQCRLQRNSATGRHAANEWPGCHYLLIDVFIQNAISPPQPIFRVPGPLCHCYTYPQLKPEVGNTYRHRWHSALFYTSPPFYYLD